MPRDASLYYDKESAKTIRVGDTVAIDPAHSVATKTRRRLVEPIQVVKIDFEARCETGVMLYVADAQDKWEMLDAGWFLKPAAVPSPDKGDGQASNG